MLARLQRRRGHAALRRAFEQMPGKRSGARGSLRVSSGVALQRGKRRGERRRKRARDRCELAADLIREHCLEPDAEPFTFAGRELAQQWRTPREQRRQHTDRPSRIVVEVAEELAPRRIPGIGVGEAGAHGRLVERPRVVDEPRRRAEARRERRLPGDARTERVDRLHGEPRRVRPELPATMRVPLERGLGERARPGFVR